MGLLFGLGHAVPLVNEALVRTVVAALLRIVYFPDVAEVGTYGVLLGLWLAVVIIFRCSRNVTSVLFMALIACPHRLGVVEVIPPAPLVAPLGFSPVSSSAKSIR